MGIRSIFPRPLVWKLLGLLVLFLALTCWPLLTRSARDGENARPLSADQQSNEQSKPAGIVAAARAQIGVTVSYDHAYRKIAYPGGDVPKETGVCSDVVIRALRAQGLDLQEKVHQDMEANFDAYPKNWGLKKPDTNIDHRRVRNLMTWFERQGLAQPKSKKPEYYAPGDIVSWELGKVITHIGIVSDRQSGTGTPLIIHNIGQGAQEEDVLFQFEIVGHYRMKEDELIRPARRARHTLARFSPRSSRS